MAIDLNTYSEKASYTLYQVFKGLEKQLLAKDALSDDDQVRLQAYQQNIQNIEAFANAKRAEGLRWSLTSIFQNVGHNPTLILEFYPGSDSYEKYGKNLVVNVEFSDADLEHIIDSIRNERARVDGTLKFKTIPDYIDGELLTSDIFAIQGTR